MISTDRVNMLFLAGLLNSRLVGFWLKHRGKMQGQNFQVDKEPLVAIPLCVPNAMDQARVANVVREIVTLKRGTSNSTMTEAKRTRMELVASQLDAQVQSEIETLYGLTVDESRAITEA